MTFEQSMAKEWAREPIADRETDIRLSFQHLEMVKDLIAFAGTPEAAETQNALDGLLAKIEHGQTAIRVQMEQAALASVDE